MNLTFSDVRKIEISKIYLKFFKVFFIFFVLGTTLIFFISYDFLLKLFDVIKIHFELPFLYSDSVTYALCRIMCFSAVDIACVFVIFIFAFSVFDFAAIYAVIAYNGIKAGVSTLLVLFCKYSVVEFPRVPSILTFFTFMILMNLFLMIFSFHSQRYVRRFSLCSEKTSFIRCWFSHLVFSAFAAIIIFVLNVIYCLIVYLT